MVAELNIPRHAYYQRRNNIRLPRRAESRTWIDTTGASVSPGDALPQPTIVSQNTTGAGGAMAFAASLIGDYLFHWGTGAALSVPPSPAGYTVLGAGLISDAATTDCAAVLSAKKVTANAEGIAAVGSSRGIGVLVRGLDPNYLADLTGDFVYNGALGTALTIPALTASKAVPYLVFSKLAGTSSIPLTGLGMTELAAAGAASAEARAAVVAATTSFAGGAIGTTTVGAGRVVAVAALYGP